MLFFAAQRALRRQRKRRTYSYKIATKFYILGRTPPFHGGNTGSNPVRVAFFLKRELALASIRTFRFGCQARQRIKNKAKLILQSLAVGEDNPVRVAFFLKRELALANIRTFRFGCQAPERRETTAEGGLIAEPSDQER